MSADTTFGFRVMEEMARQRMQQKRLAVLSGIQQSNLSRIIGGLVPNPRLGTIIRIAAALGVSVGYLCDGVQYPDRLHQDRRAD